MFQDHIHNGVFAAQQIEHTRRCGEMSAGGFVAPIGWFELQLFEEDI